MNKIKINNVDIFQPNKDMVDNFTTKLTDDSVTTQDGVSHNSVLYTKKELTYSASNVPIAEASKILRMIIGKQFNLTYFSTYDGAWVTQPFVASNIKQKVGSLKEGEEYLSSLSFNLTGVNSL